MSIDRSFALGLFVLIGCSRAPVDQSVPRLTRMLTDPDPAVQAQGAFGLGKRGPEAAPAIPELVKALSSSYMNPP